MEYWQDMDREYANGAFVPGSAALPDEWLRRAAGFRQALGARAQIDLAYGPAPRHRFDLFLPERTPRGLMVFLHGGYWLAFSKQSWSHLAAGALIRGWACAIPSYTLAPAAGIAGITQEAAAAIRAAQTLVPGPVVVTGHSAGGHLAARMACADIDLLRAIRAIPISPIADLGPLTQTAMQSDLRIAPEEAESESPARLARRAGCQVHVWVGALERPAFLWQARTLSEAWACPWTPAPGHNHFTVIDDLADPHSALMATILP